MQKRKPNTSEQSLTPSLEILGLRLVEKGNKHQEHFENINQNSEQET